MTTTRRAIGYVRVSTAAQVADGDGLAIQRTKIEAWTKYEGIELLSVEEDAGLSGSTTDRPGLRRALRAALELGSDAVLVCYRIDRIGRTAIDVQEILAVLLDAGVRVVSLADGVDSGSGMGAMVLSILTNTLATLSEAEKTAICSRLLDGRRRADAENRPYGREPRYGRRVLATEDRLVPADDELVAIDRIRQLHAEGHSVRRICALLDAEGMKPRRSARWSPAVVHRIATGKRTPPKKKPTPRLARFRAELLGDGDAAGAAPPY